MVAEELKSAGGTAAGVLMLLAFLALPVIFLLGAAEFSIWALDWIPGVIGLALLVCVILVLIAVFPASRALVASLSGICSLIFSACLWLYALAFTYIEWGIIGAVIGVLIFGVGIVFTGALAALLSATWVVLGNMVFLLALVVASRLLSAWLAHSAEQRLLRRAMKEKPSEVILTQKLRD